MARNVGMITIKQEQEACEQSKLSRELVRNIIDDACFDCGHSGSLHNNAAHCLGENCTCKAFN